MRCLDERTKQQVIGFFVAALQRSWQIGIVFAGVSVLAVFFEKRTKLRKELETDFGSEAKKAKDNDETGSGQVRSVSNEPPQVA